MISATSLYLKEYPNQLISIDFVVVMQYNNLYFPWLQRFLVYSYIYCL